MKFTVKLKSIVCMALVVSLTLTAYPNVIFANDSLPLIFEEAFDGQDGKTPEGWDFSVPATDDLGNTGYSKAGILDNKLYMELRHSGLGKDNTIIASHKFERGYSEDFEVQLDIRGWHTSSSKYTNGRAAVRLTGINGEEIFMLTLPGGYTSQWQYKSGVSGETVTASFGEELDQIGVKKSIRIFLSPQNSSADVYINGKKVLDSIDFESDTAVWGISLLASQYGKNNGRITNSAAEFDNIVISADKAINDDDVAAVEADFNELGLDDITCELPQYITTHLNLFDTANNGSNVKWVSSVPDIVSENGVVTRDSEDIEVTLTAVIHKGAYALEKSFSLNVLADSPVNYETIFSDDFTLKSDGSEYQAGDTPDSEWNSTYLEKINENTGLSIVEDPDDPGNLVMKQSNCRDVPQTEDDFNGWRQIFNEYGGEQILTFRLRTDSRSWRHVIQIMNSSGEGLFGFGVNANRTYGGGWWMTDAEFTGVYTDKPLVPVNTWANIKLVMNDIIRVAHLFVDDEYYYTFHYRDTVGNATFGEIMLSDNNRGSSITKHYFDDFKLVENIDYKLAYAASKVSIKKSDVITDDFKVPLEFDYGIGISWESSDPGYASVEADTGLVSIKRPAHGSGDMMVTLTASFEASGVVYQKDYQINIVEDISDEEKVKADEFGLEFEDFCSEPASMLTTDFSLPDVSKYGCNLVWESLNENVISINGYNAQVKRSGSENLNAKIVAHISLGDYSAEKVFELTVLRDYGVNLAESASVYDVSSEVGKYSAENTLDSNHSTFWMSASNDARPYVIYRLAPDTNADIVLVSMYSGNIKTFAVDSSNDGVIWETAYEGSGGTDYDTFALNIGVKATYLRFRVTSKQKGACGLREFQVYSYDGSGEIGEIVPDDSEHFGPHFEDPMHMSDEEFFGVWDDELGDWDKTFPGKINYSASDKLSLMEQFVKEGDYESAKSEWLYYLKSRTNQSKGPTSSDYHNADLWCDNIFILNDYVSEFTVDNIDNVIRCDVSSAFPSPKKLSLILMSRYMDEDEAVFSSREGEASPRLVVRAGNKDYTFYPQKDAYIKACDNKDNNYGLEPYLVVNEAYDDGSGEGKNTWSNDTSRAYLYFDLKGLDSDAVIEHATLELYGSTPGESAQILVLSDNDTSWSETGLTWYNIVSSDTVWQKNGCVEWNAFPELTVGMSTEGRYNIARSYYLNTLAGVYNSTGHEYYAYHAIRHAMQFIQQTGDTILTYSKLDVGIRGRQMTSAFSGLVHSSCITPEECAAITKYLYSEGEFLAMDINFRKDHNHGGFENNGFARVTMFFPEFKTYPEWLDLAMTRYTILLKNVVKEDGSYKEGTSGYATALIGNVYNGLEYMKKFGYTLDDEGREALARCVRYMCDISYPNLINFPYGDSGYASIAKDFKKYAEYLDDDELMYILTNGDKGTEPKTGPSAVYPGSHKWGIMKASWDPDACSLFINNDSADGLSHTHMDNLAIVAYGYGNTLLADAGKYSYDGTEIGNWVTSTEAHSTIMIDDLEQSRSQHGTIDKWVSNKGFDFYQGTGNLTPALTNTHSRNVLFVKPGFWIVSDALKGTGTHTYEQNWHLMYGQTPEIDPVTKAGRSTFDDAANLQVVPVDPESLTATLEDGYQCPEGGSAEHTKFLKYTKEETGNTYYDTVLFPIEHGKEAKADVNRIEMDVTPDVATAFEVYTTDESGTEKGVYYLSHEEAFTGRDFGDYFFDGKCSYVSYNNAEKLKGFYVIDGSVLMHKGDMLFETKGNSVNDLSVAYENNSIVLESEKLTKEDIKEINVYANDLTVAGVSFNGEEVDFVQAGNYVYLDGEEPERSELYFDEDTVFDFSATIDGKTKKCRLTVFEGTTLLIPGEHPSIQKPVCENIASIIIKEKIMQSINLKNMSVISDKPIKLEIGFDEYDIGFIENNKVIYSYEDLGDLKNADEAKEALGNRSYGVYKSENGYDVWLRKFAEVILYTERDTNASGGGGTNVTPSKGGSGGGAGGGFTPVTPVIPNTPQSGILLPFDDISTHWAKDDIISLHARGVVKGDGNRMFFPDNSITRAEFLAMVLRAFDIPESAYQNTFEDVNENDWFSGTVQSGLDRGIISSDVKFRPHDNITREEICKILVNVADIVSEYDEAYVLPFDDASDVSLWAVDYVKKAYIGGLINGKGDNVFEPRSNATRAEGAAMILRTLNNKT